MSILDSNYKILAKKLLLLTILTGGVFFFFLYYLNKYAIAYRPFEKKSKTLLAGKNYKYIIGGDSQGLSNINPQLFNASAVNISLPGAGISAFTKAVNTYQSSSKNKVLIYNTGFINLNDERMNSNQAGLADDILNIPIPKVLKFWKLSSLSNYLSIIRCYFGSCPFYQDRKSYQPDGFLGYKPYMGEMSSDSGGSDSYVFFKNFESLYRNLKLDGMFLENFKREIFKLSKMSSALFIIWTPRTAQVTTMVQQFGSYDKMEHLIFEMNLVADLYPNVWFLNYIDYKRDVPSLKIGHFADPSHLNSEGGKVFGKRLVQDVEEVLNRSTDDIIK